MNLEKFLNKTLTFRSFIVFMGFLFIILGIFQVIYVDRWVDAVPDWVVSMGVERETALYAHAIGDVLIGALLLSGFFKLWSGLIALSWLLALVVVSGPALIALTLRDLGLAIAAIMHVLSSKE